MYKMERGRWLPGTEVVGKTVSLRGLISKVTYGLQVCFSNRAIVSQEQDPGLN